MNQSNDRPQPIHPQNSYKGLEGLKRLSQRLGCHNATHELEELEPAIANTTGTRGSHTRAQVHNASHAQSPQTAVPTESGAASNVEQRNAFFQNAHGFNISGNPNFQNQNIGSITNIYGGGKDGLEKMEKFVLFDAQFDSAAQDPNCRCYPGTRESVLKRLGDWADNPTSAERISWLHGPAGAGKSAIARTIARSYARPYTQSNVAKVAATFFFRSDVNRSNTNRLITTLAYQLALAIPEIRDHIATSLYEHPDLPTKDVEIQFDQFLAQPFHALREDAAQQLAPAADHITNIVEKFQQLAPIIIIDGVDECTDENLQRRFLEIIGEAIRRDRKFPLRFLIVSRSERHIERAIDRFQPPILCIDLAKLDDANQDIEKYLKEQFSHIASEQDLDPTWPGLEVIDGIKRKSSGNFIFPSLVIKCVSELDNTAENLLQIVLSNKSTMTTTTTTTAFAELDKLFLETLGRVPEQDFLKKYLVLLVSRISISSHYTDLYKDDAMLMHISERELHAKLRRLCSLLKFKPEIDVHHLSFLDFLHDSSRSHQYYIPAQGGIKRYLKEFVDSFVQYVSTVIENSDHYRNDLHFKPSFRSMIEVFPPGIKLPVNEWQKVTQPLLDLQDKLLQSPTKTWSILHCKNCAILPLLRELLYLGQQLENLRGKPNTASVKGAESVRNVRKRQSVASSITSKTEKNMDGDFDRALLPLFDRLREAKEDSSSNELVNHVNAILGFDPDHATTAARVRLVSDAQMLVDVLVSLLEKNKLSPDATRKAILLTLEICARIPILPLSSFSNGNNNLCSHPSLHVNIPMQVLSQTIIASRVLDRRYIVPVLVSEGKNSVTLVSGDADYNDLSMKEGRKKIITRSGIVKPTMLGVAKAIQYLHSMGVVLHREFGSRDVFFKLDKGFPSCPKIRCLCSISQFPLEERWKEWFSPEENVFSFGRIFYELFTGIDTKPPISRRNLPKGPSVLEIPGDEWQLIQQCCAQDAGSRPTMDGIVQKMETWT